MTVPLSQKCTPAGPSSCIRMCDSKARSVDRMCFSFAATQLLGLHPWDVPWTSPKLKTYFCLSLLSLSDKPPHFTPAQPPDGKSSVFSLCLPTLTIFVFFLFSFSFFEEGGYGVCQITTLDRCLWSGQSTCCARFDCSAFRSYTVGMTGTWPGLLRALMWGGSFDDLIWSALHS